MTSSTMSRDKFNYTEYLGPSYQGKNCLMNQPVLYKPCSQDFMNGVCTQIMHLHKQRLEYYGGNYDAFIRTRGELMENQEKRYQHEQDQIAHMKNYIARFGHGSAKLARQAQSKEKTLAKMVAGGLTEKVTTDKSQAFYFYSCGTIPPPVIMVQVRIFSSKLS